MKWLQALAAFLTLLLLVTRSRCLITNFSQQKAIERSVPAWRGRKSGGGHGYGRACAMGDSDLEDGAIKRDPAIILDDRHLDDYQCDR